MNIMYSHLANEVRIVMNENATIPLVYEITDEEGKVIRRGRLSVNSKVHNISTTGMPDGQYRFQLEDHFINFDKRKLFI